MKKGIEKVYVRFMNNSVEIGNAFCNYLYFESLDFDQLGAFLVSSTIFGLLLDLSIH